MKPGTIEDWNVVFHYEATILSIVAVILGVTMLYAYGQWWYFHYCAGCTKCRFRNFCASCLRRKK